MPPGLRVSVSPRPRVSLSPYLRVSVSPCLPLSRSLLRGFAEEQRQNFADTGAEAFMAPFQVVENFDTAGQTAALGTKIGDALRSRVSKPSQTFALLTLVDQALPSRSKPGLQRLVGLR